MAFCQRSGGLHFWQSVIQLLPVLRIGNSIKVGSGTSTLFWFDRLVGGTPFAARFPNMFANTVDPWIFVEASLINLGRLAFRRPFGPPDTVAWHELLVTTTLHEPYVDQIADRTSWHLEPSHKFSMKSLYRAIASIPALEPFEMIWKIRLPLKIRIFMW
ncbi:hypothetical protein ZWY2020_034443 [Hordeum vulgare]|nr:hypothetical protein ZWY2020_034443 [Hordeum vulgare]